MRTVVYRVPGYLSNKSLEFIKGLEDAGWQENIIRQLRIDIPRFESSSIKRNFNTALLVFQNKPHDALIPFLKDLNLHIKQLEDASLLEELRSKVSLSGKDSIAAAELLLRMDGEDGLEEKEEGSGNTTINFNVKEPRSKVKITNGK